jgi:ABC-type phosphate/phosphonate transport system substrate-binding protein
MTDRTKPRPAGETIISGGIEMKRCLLFGVGVLSAIAAAATLRTSAERAWAADDASDSRALTMVVMDPLAKPLSCPCVQGYAQRAYDQLAKRLEKDLGRPVRVVYNDSLTTALKRDTKGQADLVIGKHSVVLFDAKRSQLALAPVAQLADKQGETTIRGLVVVPTDDAAKSVADLAGYRLVFGPEECDEKHAAAIALFKKNGIVLPETLETSAACSDGACSVLENAKTQRGAAVISSYARPLFEGCGTVPKGSLRLVGETEPVPFIEAFINQRLPLADREALTFALIKATNDPVLRIALETRDGFKPIEAKEVEVAKKK